MLEEILNKINADPEAMKAAAAQVAGIRREYRFIPNPGPQTQAYLSDADILLFGGEPGGGKTGLGIGLALNEHNRSLLIRKEFADLTILIDNAKGIVGTAEGFVGGSRPKYNKPDGGVIHFQGIKYEEGVDTGKQGDPHDYIYVDEAAQLPENVIRMLIGWNRTNKLGQRCRIVLGSNPPLDSTGDWLCDFFAPWLLDTYHNPAKPGELRWFIINGDGRSQEVDNGEPQEIDGVTYYPHSRTFIPSGLKDNPYIDAKEYQKKLQLIPEPYRSMLLDGNFMVARHDQDKQCIPTAWIREAQARWTSRPNSNIPMCAIGVDPAGGGDDETVISQRYDGWYAPMIVIPGRETPNGKDIAGKVIANRTDGAAVIIDMGGGYGGVPFTQLKENGVDPIAYKGAEGSMKRTADKKLGFTNKRSEAYWKFREALDPSQEGGSPIMLPDDPVLVSDLTAPIFEITPRGIKLETKEDVVCKLGRSPDRADAVVMAWAYGKNITNTYGDWKRGNSHHNYKVVLGYEERRRPGYGGRPRY